MMLIIFCFKNRKKTQSDIGHTQLQKHRNNQRRTHQKLKKPKNFFWYSSINKQGVQRTQRHAKISYNAILNTLSLNDPHAIDILNTAQIKTKINA